MSGRDAEFSLQGAKDELQQSSVDEISAADGVGELDDSRYEQSHKLGEGGAGAVYLVRDRETGETLALKRLLRMDTKSVLRLKREFRSVADLRHPNLIKLYDLGRSPSGWFFTMEYIDGVDLMTYLRSSAGNERLVTAFQQLASGVHALHLAGMLHRDLKPRNVLVAADRVRVLDFGLVRSLDETGVMLTAEGMITGTPAYMSPEQALGDALSQATDWYAFGTMLYEALSGRLPFEGGLHEVLHNKVERDPLPLLQLAPGAPAKLRELSMALLRRKPEERPGYEEIAATLAPQLIDGFTSVIQDLEAANDQTSRRSLADALFGRSAELDSLSEALGEARQGHFVVTHVRGVSGSGKSALISTFLDRLDRSGRGAAVDVLVLRSRCYEREAMPFKALDGLIDALVQFLETQNDVMVSYVLPADVADLARVFPALERLRVVRKLMEQRKARANPAQERKRAELALRNLFLRLVTQRTVVLWIDDLQWGDLDSANILKSWIQELDSAAVLLLLSYRSDERATSACLSTLEQSTPSASVRERAIELHALHAHDVEALCIERLGDASRLMAPLIARIVEEAQGSPFFASQLLTLAQAKLAQGETDLQTLSVEGVVWQASQLLSPAARRLLNVLAIAGRPVPMQVAFRAADLWQEGRSLLHDLRSLRLTRTRVVDAQKLIEIYHDRVREAVLAALGEDERVQVQRELLRAVAVSGGGAEPDWMYVLAAGAGENEAALRYGLQAAERADKTLAFERAADLYQHCIELSEKLGGGEQSAEIWLKLAVALGLGRRGARAAEAYLEAASRGSPARSVELMRLAATHLLRSGRFEEGQALADRVLAELKLSVPSTEVGLYAAIGWEQVRLRLRGMTFEPRKREQAPPQLMAAMTTYAALSVDLQAIDPLRAALFQARYMRTALETGVPAVVASALCAHATSACLSGSVADGERAAAMLDRAEALAADDSLGKARVFIARAMCALLLGRPAQVVEAADRADRLYRVLVGPDGKTAGEDYYRVAMSSARIGALLQTGRTRDAIAGLRSEEAAARATEDRTASLHLSLVSTIADQVEARFADSRVRLMQERAELPKQGFGPLHLLHITSVMWAGCVAGEGEWAEQLVSEDWPRFLRFVVRRSAYLSTLGYGAHARFVLNRHIATRSAEDPAALLKNDLRALGKLPPHLGRPVIAGLHARIAYLAGDRARAAELLRQHNELYLQGQALNEAAFGRLALGRLTSGNQGDAISLEAEQTLRDLGFVDPSSILPLHFPELHTTLSARQPIT